MLKYRETVKQAKDEDEQNRKERPGNAFKTRIGFKNNFSLKTKMKTIQNAMVHAIFADNDDR